jgi:hypothetical protein
MKAAALLCVVIALAPAVLAAQSLNTMSLNGATGLYTVPTGRIGWTDTNLGLDFGYQTIIAREDMYRNGYGVWTGDDHVLNHIPRVGVSLFKVVELGMAFDFQPDYGIPNGGDLNNNNDLLLNVKFQLPTKATAVALGSNFQILNLGNDARDFSALQFYVAVTYAGTFFTLPAETTVALGKTFTFGDHPYDDQNSNLDFGMGFDLTVFPKQLKGLIHWVIDYSNFSYSADPWGADAGYRGAFNTGLRFNLSAIPALSKYKFVIDASLTDAFDEYYRSFSFGLVIGIPIL